MMTPVWMPPPIIETFISNVMGRNISFGPCQSMGVVNNIGNLVAGVVFNTYRPEFGTIDVSGASIDKRWLTRGVVRAIFSYPFDEVGCQAVVFRTSEENHHLRRMLVAHGASEHIIPRLRGRNAGEVVLVVTDEVWQQSRFRRLH